MSERTQTRLLELCDQMLHHIDADGISAPCLSYKPSKKALAQMESERKVNRDAWIPVHVCMPVWTLPVKEDEKRPGGAYTVVKDSYRGMAKKLFCVPVVKKRIR